MKGYLVSYEIGFPVRGRGQMSAVMTLGWQGEEETTFIRERAAETAGCPPEEVYITYVFPYEPS